MYVISALVKQICCFLADKKAGKFKEWLDCASLIDLKPNTPVMEIFSFLAYETVGQVSNKAKKHFFCSSTCAFQDLH